MMDEELNNENEAQVEDIIPFKSLTSKREDATVAFPWYSEVTRKIIDPILRLHNETIQFYLFVSPESDKETQERNERLYERIKGLVNQWVEDASVVSPFFDHKLYLRGTEIEIYLLVDQLDREKATKIIDLLGNELKNSRLVQIQNQERYLTFEFQLEMEDSKVIVRMVERQDWQEYLTLVEEGLTNIVELKYLFVIMTCMIRQRWMHMTIRPVLIFGLLSVFYHERRKQRYRTLSENIIKFVEYYGVGPFQERRVNYLGKGRYELLQEGQNQNQTPFSFWINPRVNISSPLLRDFFALLKNRYRLISNYNFDDEQSIIGCLVNACGKEFQYI